ncbi:MAG: PAS domain S-box protein [Byssovorax sp.]
MSPTATGPLDEPTLTAVAGAILEAAGKAGICVIVLGDFAVQPPERIYVGESITEILGYTIEEFRSLSSLEVLSAAHLEEVHSLFRRSRQGEAVPRSIELDLPHKDGHTVPVELSVSTATCQGKQVMVGFLRDIRERKGADDALRRSEARFRKLIESAPDLICVSRAGKVLYANPSFVRLAGYETVEEVLGKSLADMVHEDERQVVSGRLSRVDAGAVVSTTQEYRVRRPDGKPAVCEFFAIPIEYEGAPAALSFGRDITERRRLHEQLVQSARMAALGVVAAGVAHEINNPLAYVLLNLGFLARELPGLIGDAGARERILEMLKAVREGTDRVAVIARDMRSLAREGGAGPADLRMVLDSCLNILGGELRPKARVVREYQEVPSVAASPERLGQLFLNLILNAAQALPPGGADLNEVRVAVRSGAGGTVLVEISDTGVGIPPELQELIFEPFFTTKPMGMGTGLGLSICQGIVASLGGEIRVESAPGKGTTFRVILPAGDARPFVVPHSSDPPPLSVPRSTPAPGDAPRLLIIDDERALGAALRAVLSEGYTVTVVNDGQEGLDLLLGGKSFEVILCDLLMPGITGMDVYARVREARPHLASRFVFMTGAPLMPAVAAFLERVKNPRLHKPIDLAALEEQIEGLLRRS